MKLRTKISDISDTDEEINAKLLITEDFDAISDSRLTAQKLSLNDYDTHIDMPDINTTKMFELHFSYVFCHVYK